MEYYSAIKRNEIGSFIETWMDLESVLRSEVSLKEKNKYCILTHICGITEAEEQISELEDRMMEVTAAEYNKEKRMKELRTVLETSGTILNAPTFKL